MPNLMLHVHSSDLEKIFDTLHHAAVFHVRRDEMNAQLHLASTTRYSPLTSELQAACDRLDNLLQEHHNRVKEQMDQPYDD